MTRDSMSTDTRKGDSPPGFVKCPSCNAWVDKKETKCTTCGSAMVASKKCPHCYGDIDARASACPHCGKNVKVKTAGYQIGSFLMAAGLLLIPFDIFVTGTGCLILAGALLMLIGLAVRRNV